MRELTRNKIARQVSSRLPGLLANYLKAAAVALVHGLVKEGVLIEPPKRPRGSPPGSRSRSKPPRKASTR